MNPQILVFSSRAAALQATPFFVEESGRGCWVQTDAVGIASDLYERRSSSRYALHIPSQTRHHVPLPEEQIQAFEAAARAIGLVQISPATGFWTLDSGILQEEPLRIAWSEAPVDVEALERLAYQVLTESEQEAVAMEVGGRVEVIRG